METNYSKYGGGTHYSPVMIPSSHAASPEYRFEEKSREEVFIFLLNILAEIGDELIILIFSFKCPLNLILYVLSVIIQVTFRRF